MKNLLLIVCFIFVNFLIACGGGGSNPGDEQSENTAPFADAGQNQNVFLNEQVELDASSSSDADDDALTYAWQFSQMPVDSQSQLSSPTDIRPTFNPDKVGTYELSLVVSDGDLSSEQDLVTISVDLQNTAPIANAGRDQNVSLRTLVWLDGSDSLDNEGQSLSYLWQFTQIPAGSNAVLVDPESVTPHFTATLAGFYEIELVVNDGLKDSYSDTVSIIVSADNSVPVAHAGDDQNVPLNSQVNLDASFSSDADNEPLTYLWTIIDKPASSEATLSSSTNLKPTFIADKRGSYQISLSVSDIHSTSELDLVEITVNSDNNSPSANAGADQQVFLNQSVSLNASGSEDPDGDPLSYSWSFVSKPSSSQSNLLDNDSVSPNFTTDQLGQYLVKVVVSDDKGASTSDNVLVTVIEEDTLLVGIVTGVLVDTQGNPLASVHLKVDGIEVVSDQAGVFSTVIEAAENDTALVETNDSRIPGASYTSERITRNDSIVGYDFAVNLNSQKMPVFQSISVNLFSCSFSGGTYSGPDPINVIFTLEQHESTLFNIEHQQVIELEVDGSVDFQLPALSDYKVTVDGFHVAGVDGLFDETASFTHYAEGGITTLYLCDPD